MYLIFDTETTGLPQRYNQPHTNLNNWPRLVQLAWQVHDGKGGLINRGNFIVKPVGFTIPYNAEKVHGISTDRALKEGHDLGKVLEVFLADVARSQHIIGHNIDFDRNIVGAELIRASQDDQAFMATSKIDTKDEATEYTAIPGGRGGGYKWPTLTELHTKLFGTGFADAHDAAYDVDATSKCFFGLLVEGVIAPKDGTPVKDIKYEPPKLDEANFAKKESTGRGISQADKAKAAAQITAPYFHLHVHSQFSVLQSTTQIKALIKKAKEEEMPAVALTDLGNMYAIFQFVREALKAELKPIVGCEFFVAEERKKTRFTKDNPDKRFQQVLLAKNKAGYHNLAKLSSLAFTEGNYGIYPRIDKALIEAHREGLIALTGDLSGEVPNLILNVGEHQAEEAFQYWHSIFGDDYYVSLQRHGLPEEDHANKVLLGFAKKYGVKVVATHSNYYLNSENAEAHDILLCIKESEVKSTPIGRGKGKRFGFPNQQYYFKGQQEMKTLFYDLPEAVENLTEIFDKVEPYKLERDVLLPKFEIPAPFETEDDYLRHLTYEGAKKRYGLVTAEISERLDFELATIKNTGYPGYFLIVQDFTNEARNMGVSVGPGRGSAAGSAVAYCIGITNVDPIKYDLLFERFLNPDRVSLPDIDIDFDDEGRGRIIKWVVDKYGENQVAQIITYGSMAAKSAIRDSARVMELPLGEANDLAKLIPEKPGTTLRKAYQEVPELETEKRKPGLRGDVLKQAEVLEGSVRNTGIHACGVIITPADITNYIPVSVSKDKGDELSLRVTQFDNSVVESAGMLKMDFLGLKTLTIIKTAIEYIKEKHNVEIVPDDIPLDDTKTYELYQRGHTNGTFQFESPGMQKHLRNLKPDKFEDLIAMNALYRPGPLEYIPNFIARKHGKEPITYDLADMEEYLAETYGITVYQEQVMLLSQKLAGFTKGMADSLRKGMGKKKKEIIDMLKPKFIDGCKERGHDPKVAEKVWKDWEAFAAYAFNKSHSTCYSVVAFHTAYLKAHYPAEYMASVLTHNQSNIEKVTFFMEECKSQGIKVLGPSVNESGVNFMVNNTGQIRFGLGAIKGAGEAAVSHIIDERKEKGPYKDIYDFMERIQLGKVNKKTLECLAMGGAFDCFPDYHRRQYLEAADNDSTLIEKLVKYAQRQQQEALSAQTSLFGGAGGMEIPKPKVPYMEPYGQLRKLQIEKEVVGLYLTGHPLDQFRLEMESFCTATLADLRDLDQLKHKGQVAIGGIVSGLAHRTTKNGKPFGTLTLEDYNDSFTFFLFSDDYVQFRNYFIEDQFLFLKGSATPRKWGDGELEFKVNQIQLLSEIREKMSKGVAVNLSLYDIDMETVMRLEDIVNKHPGSCPLRFTIVDPEKQWKVATTATRYKVNPSTELLNELEQLQELKYQIISA